jgi:hypothetical protein
MVQSALVQSGLVQSGLVKSESPNVARRRTEHFAKIFGSRSGLFVGSCESFHRAWGKSIHEKEISPWLVVRAER